jgi:hypothetical protein
MPLAGRRRLGRRNRPRRALLGSLVSSHADQPRANRRADTARLGRRQGFRGSVAGGGRGGLEACHDVIRARDDVSRSGCCMRVSRYDVTSSKVGLEGGGDRGFEGLREWHESQCER